MHEAINQMLKKYHCHGEQDYINAVKEIFQEIALLGLWRAKFYEKAAFYGGSALRILYGLDRFSEDLDFSLLKPDKSFGLAQYNQAIADELNSFGFDVSVETKVKSLESNIKSAFIKASSKKQLIVIKTPANITSRIHKMQKIKIKMEVDVDPPGKFSTEVKNLLLPIPFAVKTFVLSDLFAGKIHALLCRPWQKRVKGRDWYDFVWYVARKVPVNLEHLTERLIQSQAWSIKKQFSQSDLITKLKEKVEKTDFDIAKQDVVPFLRDLKSVDLWSNKFFDGLVDQLVF